MIIKKIKNIILKKNSKIKDAIVSLNKTGNQIILLVDKNNKLIGTVTDGDIRRGILKGYKLSDSILKVTSYSPIFTKEKLSQSNAIKIMKDKNIGQLPMTNKFNKIKGVYFLNKLTPFKKKNNIFFIMAGGRGRRLKPYTDKCPKPLLKIRGKPMLQHIFEKSKKQGFSNYYVSINYLGDLIKDFFKSGSSLGIKIKYINEKKKLGTAGSLSYIKSKTYKPVIVTNGDVITDINYSDMLEFHNNKKSDFTLAVYPYLNQNPYGIVETSNYDVVKIKEKPIVQSNINAGVYIINHKILNLLKKNKKITMVNLISEIKKKNYKILAYALHEEWRDIGHIDDFKKVK